MWFQGGFAALVQTESFLSVAVDYSNITKVLAIVGEAVKETKTFEKMIEVQQRDFKTVLDQERAQTSALEKSMTLVLSRSEEQAKQLETLRSDFQNTTGQLEKRVAALERAIYGAAAVSGATDAQATDMSNKDLGNVEGLGIQKYAQDNYEAIRKMHAQVGALEEMEEALGRKVSASLEGIEGLKVEIAEVVKCPVATELNVLGQLIALGKSAQDSCAAPLKGWHSELEGVRSYSTSMAAEESKGAMTLLHHLASDMRDKIAPLVAESHAVIADAATSAMRVAQLLTQQQQQQQQPNEETKRNEDEVSAKQAELSKLMQAKAATDAATLNLGRELHERWKTYNEAGDVDTTGELTKMCRRSLSRIHIEEVYADPHSSDKCHFPRVDPNYQVRLQRRWRQR
jgi:hypothetical protein